MFKIQLNESGSHFMTVEEKDLRTIQNYKLFDGLLNSSGYITENELYKLKLNIRSLIASSQENTKELLDLCIDIIYHDKMKAYGLRNLVKVYQEWEQEQLSNENK